MDWEKKPSVIMGRSKSDNKARASAENGRRGGRPRKSETQAAAR